MHKTQESINNLIERPLDKQVASFSAINQKPLKLTIVSDLHLGYKNSDKDSFNRFLDSLRSDEETTDLVLLGDIVDMETRRFWSISGKLGHRAEDYQSEAKDESALRSRKP